MGDPLRDRCPPRELAAVHQAIEIAEKILEFNQLVTVMEADLSALDAARMPAKWREFPVNAG